MLSVVVWKSARMEWTTCSDMRRKGYAHALTTFPFSPQKQPSAVTVFRFEFSHRLEFRKLIALVECVQIRTSNALLCAQKARHASPIALGYRGVQVKLRRLPELPDCEQYLNSACIDCVG